MGGRRRLARWLGAAAALIGSLVVPEMSGEPAEAIIGGVGVESWIYPQFVPLRTQECGATVIAEDTLLTAAHCVDGPEEAFGPLVNGWWFQSLTIHPLWNGDSDDGHDLAIVRVAAGSTSLAGITPIQVGSPWDTSYYEPDTPATIVGMGATHDGGGWIDELRAVDTVLRSDSDMDDVYNKWYTFDHWNEPYHIGAGSSSQTACNGDSGGPVVVDKDGTWNWIQVGVASFGSRGFWFTEGCDEPAGFSELNGAHLAWIAREAPAVMARWGPCYDVNGYLGASSATYQAWYSPTAQKDGPNYWELRCNYAPSGSEKPPPAPPGDEPPSEEPPPSDEEPPPPSDPGEQPPSICDRQPWKCETAL